MFGYNNIIEKGEPQVKEPIDSCLDNFHELPPYTQRNVEGSDCIVVEHFLSDEECDAIVEACEGVGYTYWHQMNHEEQRDEAKSNEKTNSVRIVDTIEATFPRLSDVLTKRVMEIVRLEPKRFSPQMDNAEALFERDIEGTWMPHALSPNLLLGKYNAGGHFMPHVDGSTIVDLNTRSMYTLLVYLNDVDSGGETFLLSGDQCSVTYLDPQTNTLRGNPDARTGAIKPKKGSAAFFYHSLLHEGAPVLAGVKYICRADLLYRRTPPILTAPEDVKAFELYENARLEESKGNVMEACRMFQKVRNLSRGVAELYQLD
eukprot:gene7095-5029_t